MNKNGWVTFTIVAAGIALAWIVFLGKVFLLKGW